MHITIFIYLLSKDDEWDVLGDHVKLNKTLHTVEFTKMGYKSAYGKVCVSSGKHEWKLKIINNIIWNGGMVFGITTTTIRKNRNFFNFGGSLNRNHYSYGFGKTTLLGGGHTFTPKGSKEKPIKNFNWKTNDIITLSLNLDTAKFIIKRNENVVAKIDDVVIDLADGVKYRLAVSGYEPGTTYELVSYYNVHRK